MKNRKLLLIVSLVLAMTMSLGGTLAYLSDTDADVNVMTLGSVTITQNEQERDADGNLVPFTPNKPAMPAVGPIGWADEGVEVNGTEYKVFTDDLKNVVDKIVTVTNTGKSDAYVRTIVAIEAPDYDPDDLIHFNWNDTDCSISAPITVEIGEDDYVAFVFTYKEALGAGETSAPSLVQLFLDKATTNEDVAAFGDTWEVLVLSQAIQKDGFADPTTALNEGFGAIDKAKVEELFGNWEQWDKDDIGTPGDKWPNNNPPVTGAVVVKNDAELLKAIQDPNVKTIAIDGDLTYDWGGDSYANSKALLMKGKTIVGVDDEASITFAGYGSANPIVDVTLSNITVMDATKGDDESSWEHGYLEFKGLKANNVVFKDIMLDGNCELVNCTFNNETESWYAAWVEGGNATFKNCTFTGTRAIKTHEAYGSDVASVVVDNCSFTLSEKPGVVIGTLNDGTSVTIKNSSFATQAGDQGKFIYETDSIEPTLENNTLAVTVSDEDELAAAVAAGATDIMLADGEYDVYGCGGKNLTISGSKNAVIKLHNDGEDGCDYAFGGNGTGVGQYTFNGVTFDTTSNTGNYKGFAYMGATYNNCNFVGAFSLNNANDYVFNNCTFDFKNGYFWTWGANSVTFNNCTFNGNSKAILAHGYASTAITINNCDFAATEKGYASSGTVWTAAVEIDPAGSNTYTINFTGENTINENYAGWTRIKDESTGHTITGLN